MALGQPMRPAPTQRGATPQTPSARPRPGMGVRPAPPMRPGPPGQMQTAGPPMGSFNNLQIPGRPPIGQPMPGRVAGPAGPPGFDPRGAMPPPRGIPGGEMGGPMNNSNQSPQQRMQIQQAAGVFDRPQPPPQMQSIQPPQMGGIDPAMLQQKMAAANQMRDQFRMNNPAAMQGAPPDMGGRQMPDIAGMRERMMQMRGGGGGPVY